MIENKKTSDKLLYEIVIFILIFTLMISIVFTFDRLFFQKPIDNCYDIYQKDFRNDKCEYDNIAMNQCYAKEGQVIFNNDCTLTCDYCYKAYNEKIKDYNNKTNLLRIILSFVIALSLAFINLKDKIIRYSLLSGSLVSLFVSTMMAMQMIGILLPIVIIIEFLLVLFIYKKTK